VSILFTFLARQMARPDHGIVVDRALFEKVLESLCSGEGVTGPSEGEGSRHEERQQALLELLKAGGLRHCSNESRLVTLSDGAGFYRVCEALYEKRRKFSRVPSCYWHDDARKNQVFYLVLL